MSRPFAWQAWCISRIVAGVQLEAPPVERLFDHDGWAACQAALQGGANAFKTWCSEHGQPGQRWLHAVLDADPREGPPRGIIPGDTWELLSLADACAPRPPRLHVVSGLFLAGTLNILYGAPGTFKSLLLADLALCVAAGQAWLPPLPSRNDVAARAVTPGPVLFLDFDNGRFTTFSRLEALIRSRELTSGDVPFHYYVMPDPWLDALDPTGMDMLGQRIDALGATLVILDNLGDIAGKADENSVQMASVMGAFRRLAERTQAAVVLVHHQRKSSGFNSRAGEMLRGHSSIEAALDLALVIEREERSESVKLRSTKARGADVLPFGAFFAYEHWPGTDQLAQACFYGQAVEDVLSDRAIQTQILEVVTEKPRLNKGELKEEVKGRLTGVGINRIGENIDRLVDKGELSLRIGERNAKLYTLASHEQPSLTGGV